MTLLHNITTKIFKNGVFHIAEQQNLKSVCFSEACQYIFFKIIFIKKAFRELTGNNTLTNCLK